MFHGAYRNPTTTRVRVVSIHVVGTRGALLASTHRVVMWFGVLDVIGVIGTFAVKRHAFTSVWCAHAAPMSMAVARELRRILAWSRPLDSVSVILERPMLPAILDLPGLRALYASGELTPLLLAQAICARLRESADPAIFISWFGEDVLVEQAEALMRRAPNANSLPLWGIPFAVKDNIDVAGLPTTAACPAFAYQPSAAMRSSSRGCARLAPSWSARPTSTNSRPG